jgi:MFS family permease
VRRFIPDVLRSEPQFRLLFTGQALSVVGDRVMMVALPFAVLSIGGGAREVGLVSGAQFLPFAVLALVAGVVADRVDRKLILVASDVVRLGCQVVGGTLLISDVAEVWHLATLAALYGAADAFFSPAFTGLLPQTVAAANLQPANALRGLSFSVGSIAGPALAGGLVALVGPGGALLFDAATFVVSVGCLLPLRPSVLEREAEGEPTFLAGFRGGWHEVRTRSWVWTFLIAMSVYHVVVLPAVFVLGPVLAERELDGARAGPSSRHPSASRAPRRPAAAAVAAVPGPARLGAHARRRVDAGCDHRQRSGHLGDRRARAARRHLCHRLLHALGGVAAGAHPLARAVAGIELRLPGERRPDALGDRRDGPRRPRVRAATDPCSG